MWRYLLALGAALYLGMWFVGDDHGQQRWGLRDTPTPVNKPVVPEEPETKEVSAITPATPLVPVPPSPVSQSPSSPVVQPVPESAFSAEAQSAAATEVEPEAGVFTLADPSVASTVLSGRTITTPDHDDAAAAMSVDPFAPPENTSPATVPVQEGVGVPAALPANARTIIGRAVNLRKGPSDDELAVTTLFKGDIVEVLAKTLNGWVQVRSLSDGSAGYLPSRFVSTRPLN